jgi:aspartate aminotransferase
VFELSKRIQNVKSSPTVALNAKAKALAKAGVNVLSFAVGEPDFPTPPAVVDVAIKALQAGKTKYGPAGGSQEFRDAICEKLKRQNDLTYSPEQIVVGMGAKEILFHLFMALCNDGDDVIVPSPYWVSYPDQILAQGARPICLPLSPDMSKEPLRVEDIKKAATKKTVGIVLNSPNNPAGFMYSKEMLLELGAFLKTNNWWIISDEIYEYMAFDRKHYSLLSLFPELKDRYFYVNGMSKGFAMTGWRVGYVAGTGPAIKMVRDLQSHTSTCLPPFIEEAATFAIKQGKNLLTKEIEILNRRRRLAMSLLDGIKDVSYVEPHGAFYLFIDVRKALAGSNRFKDQNTMRFSEELLSEHHIAVVPGDAFGAPGFLRFSYATDDKSITEGLARLKKALQQI